MSILRVQKIRHTASNTDVIDIANDGTCRANITNNLSNRRLTINGDMRIAQRGVTFNSISTGQVATDRFRFEHGGSSTTDVINVTQKSNAARDIGFEHSLKAEVATVDSSLASDHYTQFKYLIEAQDIVKQSQYGLSSAKQMTLSFYVKCSVTGTFPLALNDGTGSRSNPHVYTINSANTWERKTITFNGDTGGNWQNQANNGAGFGIRWGLAVGSGYFGTADGNWSADSSYANLYASYSNSFITTQGATWELTGVQLEIGSVATDFEHRTFAEELRLCQRYFQKSFQPDVTPAASVTECIYTFTRAYTSGFHEALGNDYVVEMRAKPSVTFYPIQGSGSAGQVSYYDGSSGGWANTTGYYHTGHSTPKRLILSINTTSSTTLLQYNYTLAAEL